MWWRGGPGLKHYIDHAFEESVGDSHSDHDFNGVMRFDEKEFYLQLTNLEKILWTGGWRHCKVKVIGFVQILAAFIHLF